MSEPTEVRTVKKSTYVNERESDIIARLVKKRGSGESTVLREAVLRLAREEGIE